MNMLKVLPEELLADRSLSLVREIPLGSGKTHVSKNNFISLNTHRLANMNGERKIEHINMAQRSGTVGGRHG
jgi:hypothetical protein